MSPSNKDPVFRDGLLSGHRILVTGGGTGLGREIAAKYLSLGAAIWICGRRGGLLDDTAAALTAEHGGIVKTHAVDLRSAEAVEAMVEAIWTEGPLTGLVNNAAGNFISPTEQISSRGFDAIAGVVLHGTFYVTNAVGRRWIRGGLPGSIVSILTTWVRTGSPFTVPSAMAKSGIDAMTKSLAIEWGRHGIRANAIAPGVFPTEGMTARLDPGEDGGMRGAVNPMGRVGRMEELQNLAAFLMAPGCEWLTGETIAIDGAGHHAYGAQFTRLFSLSEEDWAERRRLIKEANERDKAARSV